MINKEKKNVEFQCVWGIKNNVYCEVLLGVVQDMDIAH